MRQTSQSQGLCLRSSYARQEEGTDGSKCQVALPVSPRVSYKLVWVGRKERPAVQKATATAPWTLSTLERKGTRHHTCALRSPARESAYRYYAICTTYAMTTLRPGQRRTCTCSPSRRSTVYLNVCTDLDPPALLVLHPFDTASQLFGLQRAAPRPTTRGTTVP